jgi:hypothetical protein
MIPAATTIASWTRRNIRSSTAGLELTVVGTHAGISGDQYAARTSVNYEAISSGKARCR